MSLREFAFRLNLIGILVFATLASCRNADRNIEKQKSLDDYKYIVGINLGDCISCNAIISTLHKDSATRIIFEEGAILYGDERQVEIEHYFKKTYNLEFDESQFHKNKSALASWSERAGMPVTTSFILVLMSGKPTFLKPIKSMKAQNIKALKELIEKEADQQFSEQDKAELVAFLETLTDQAIADDPKFSDPFK